MAHAFFSTSYFTQQEPFTEYTVKCWYANPGQPQNSNWFRWWVKLTTETYYKKIVLWQIQSGYRYWWYWKVNSLKCFSYLWKRNTGFLDVFWKFERIFGEQLSYTGYCRQYPCLNSQTIAMWNDALEWHFNGIIDIRNKFEDVQDIQLQVNGRRRLFWYLKCSTSME